MSGQNFHLYASSHLDQLGSQYLSDRESDLKRFRSQGWLFAPESVIVPSRGIATWLEHYLVEKGKVSMGMSYPLQSNGMRQLLCRLVPELKDSDAYTPAVMKWEIFHLLTQEADPLWKDEATMKSLKAYLTPKEQKDTKTLRAFQLAEKIASLFDQYQSYLPLSLSQWAKGEKLDLVVDGKNGDASSQLPLPADRRWQSRLWHRLCECLRTSGTSETSPGISVAEAIARVLTGDLVAPTETDVQPVTLFGATMMPPSYLQILKKYSEFAPVNFYYHTPCEEFWGDNARTKERRAMSQEEREGLIQNTLLTDFACQAQNFFNALLDICGDDLTDNQEIGKKGAEIDEATSLLNTIQTLILKNKDPQNYTEGSLPAFSQGGAPAPDDSLVVHKCHSITRQVEVLRDQLLQILKTGNGEPTNSPKYSLNDILVMAPDITQFAPAIKAVFDEPPLKGLYAVTDRSLRQTNLLAQTFLGILQLPESHFQHSKIDAFLDSSALCRKFGLPEAQIPEIRQWLQEGKVCLGYDGESRKEDFLSRGIEGVDAKRDEYTWRNALDRMLLSQAIELPAEEDDQHPGFGELLPLPVTSSQGDVPSALGNLSRLLRLLHETCGELGSKANRTMSQWRELLESILDRFFALDTDSTEDFALLKRQLREQEKHAGMTDAKDAALPLSLVRNVLQGTLERSTSTKGAPFLGGKITCCSLMPMRGVPCKVIAILGMDEGAFPRQEEHLGFSLVNDKSLLPYYVRSKVEEDRYLFLEAVLAPKDKLLLFYKGFEESKGDELPPASVVSQLLNYTEKLHKGLSDKITATHPLNSFDPKNFRQEDSQAVSLRDPFSFSEEDWKIAEYAPKIVTASVTDDPSIPQPRKFPETLALNLTDLQNFLQDGIEAYYQKALGFGSSKPQKTLSFGKKQNNESSAYDQEPLDNDDLQASLCRKKLVRVARPYVDKASGTLDPSSEALQKDLEQCKSDFRGKNMLPYGILGENSFHNYQEELENNAKELSKLGLFSTEDCECALTFAIPLESGDTCTVILKDDIRTAIQNGTQSPRILHPCFGEKISRKHKLLACLQRLLWQATHTKGTPIPAYVFSVTDPQNANICDSCAYVPDHDLEEKEGEKEEKNVITPEMESQASRNLLETICKAYLQTFQQPIPIHEDSNKDPKNILLCHGEDELKSLFPGVSEDFLQGILAQAKNISDAIYRVSQTAQNPQKNSNRRKNSSGQKK